MNDEHAHSQKYTRRGQQCTYSTAYQ